MKRIIWTLLIVCILHFSLCSVNAATDVFPGLDALSYGSPVSQAIFAVGESHGTIAWDGQTVNVYTFPSGLYSNPHVLYESGGTVVFLQLTLPEEGVKTYADELTGYGTTGQIQLPKTKSEILLGYPEKGMAFVVNGYTNAILRVMKFRPKDEASFREIEGRNFKPVPYPTEKPANQTLPPPAQPGGETVADTSGQRPIPSGLYGSLLALGIIVVLLILLFIIRRKRRGRVYRPK